ncbi:hypothetical protein [Psychrosphaera haliotis]|uniref:Uncharacterized protein n=1 Tax=Psychrosphaera haliotis TaxID=555083 RepID=A0A6N8F8B7_9GAMM|nr:hypothetical protein [Psychrosphaera haliotis]MUH72653.1 hypothetical protein [Psychrosphaera haliotis]
MRLLTLTLVLSLAGCASQEIQYPAEQTTASAPTANASLMRIAKSAYEFEDKDIQVPANFDTQGLQFCDDEFDIEKNACPLDKKAIRIYFGDNKIDSKYAPEAAALTRLNNKTLGLMLENQLAGVNRFRIVTNDNDTIALEKQKQFEEQDVKTVAELNKNAKVLRPDYAVKIDTIKSADRFYGEHNGLAQYHVEMSTSVINPYTKEKLAYPNLGKIRVKGTDVSFKRIVGIYRSKQQILHRL